MKNPAHDKRSLFAILFMSETYKGKPNLRLKNKLDYAAEISAEFQMAHCAWLCFSFIAIETQNEVDLIKFWGCSQPEKHSRSQMGFFFVSRKAYHWNLIRHYNCKQDEKAFFLLVSSLSAFCIDAKNVKQVPLCMRSTYTMPMMLLLFFFVCETWLMSF